MVRHKDVTRSGESLLGEKTIIQKKKKKMTADHLAPYLVLA